ncbi:MAG: Gfo/Idh/MocA family oxidoreductase [Candidatus Latescibacteria bacterium]|nr:Gfo/Idh/MocA family oxidoreductase [Candidatus Latescibacterota bacterium]
MNKTRSPLRVGIVGCGSFGRKTYAYGVAEHPGAVVTALCDVERGRAEALARELSEERGTSPRPGVYEDYRPMIEQEPLDVVMVGTLADVRPAVTLAALNAGAHVLAAKPMAPSLGEAEEMLRTAKQVNRLLMVGYNFRFREDAQIMRRFIREGGLGRPLFARAWSHEASVPTWGPHYIRALSGGGSLASTAVHVIDLAVWFLGCPPLLSVDGHSLSRFADLPSLPPKLEAVRDTYDAEDLVSGYARFADGVTMSVEGMWLTPPQIDGKGVDVWGTEGYASLSPLRLLTWRDGDYADRTAEGGLADAFQDDSSVRNRREVCHFLDCVLGEDTPLITPQEMWTDQAIVEGIYAGHREFDPSP